MCVGAPLGMAEGSLVGTDVGAAEGVAVGTAVGANVGSHRSRKKGFRTKPSRHRQTHRSTTRTA
jgi:hypothetical protein